MQEIGRFSALEQIELTVIRDQAISLTMVIRRLDRDIEAAAAAFDGYEPITSIKSIGPRAAAVLLSAIGDIDDFESADKLAAYFGLVPRVSQSNETDNRGRIKERRGAGKTIIATARKLLAIIFDTLKNNWVFEDFPSFKIQGIPNPYGQTS